MDAIIDYLLTMSGGRPTTMLSVLVFLAPATLAFGIMAMIHVRTAVKRRAAGVASAVGARPDADPNSLRQASRKIAQRLIDYTTKHYSGQEDGDKRKLRLRMIQAGFLDPRAVPLFFMARIGLAIALV